jgi:hypothetical protein
LDRAPTASRRYFEAIQSLAAPQSTPSLKHGFQWPIWINVKAVVAMMRVSADIEDVLAQNAP